MNNKVLLTLVIILALALVGVSAYFLGAQHGRQNGPARANLNLKSSEKLSGLTERRAPQLPMAWTEPSFFDSHFDSWDPFEEMERLHTRINRLFRDSFSRSMIGPALQTVPRALFFEPEADISETDAHYLIKLDLPGMEKDKINVEVKNRYLTISGERKTEETKEGTFYYRSERSFGTFSRTIPLPEDANVEDVTAEHVNGVLTIKIAKIKTGSADTKTGTKVSVG